MLLAIVITLVLNDGSICTKAKEASYKGRPIKLIQQCQNYAKEIEERLNASILNNNRIKSVKVECKRLPKHDVITKYK